jgi:hypothetical protein
MNANAQQLPEKCLLPSKKIFDDAFFRLPFEQLHARQRRSSPHSHLANEDLSGQCCSITCLLHCLDESTGFLGLEMEGGQEHGCRCVEHTVTIRLVSNRKGQEAQKGLLTSRQCRSPKSPWSQSNCSCSCRSRSSSSRWIRRRSSSPADP